MPYKIPPKNRVKFKKGQSGNPKGRPAVVKAIADVKKEIGDMYVSLIREMLAKSQTELKKIVESKTEPSFRQIIASVIYRAIGYGDPNRLETFMNRVIGKVKDEIDLGDSAVNLFFNLPRPETPRIAERGSSIIEVKDVKKIASN